ncbi:MAG: ferritin [Candidatus Lokiarchaeota archaeon]|nr:ferritin [Candidatus Lokiarchaeota archaeon]
MTIVNVFVCKICGEAYIGEEEPSRCPFCGAHRKYFVKASDYDDFSAWDVELNEKDKKNAKKALDVEISNTVFYKCSSNNTPELEGQKLFKILSKVENEHASVWKKILKLDKIDLPKYDECASEYNPNLEESHQREERAIKFYGQAAAEAQNARVKEIFQALIEVETDHLRLSEERLKK